MTRPPSSGRRRSVSPVPRTTRRPTIPLVGTVIATAFLGAVSRVTVDLGGGLTAMAQLPTSDAAAYPAGTRARLSAAPRPRPGHARGRRRAGCRVTAPLPGPGSRTSTAPPSSGGSAPAPVLRAGTRRSLPPGGGRRRRAARGPRRPRPGCGAAAPIPGGGALLVAGPRHRPAAGGRAVADAVRVPQPGVRRPAVRDDRAGAAAAGGPDRARGRGHPPHGERAFPAAPVSGAPLQLAVTTGDAIDNAQWNEAQNFLRLFDGGLVRPGSGGPRVRGRAVAGLGRRHLLEAGRRRCVRSPTSSGTGSASPQYPGLLERALADFTGHRAGRPLAGLLRQPRGAEPGCRPGHAGAGGGAGRRAQAARLPPEFDPDRALEPFTLRPETFIAGDLRRGHRRPGPAADHPGREFVEAHFLPGQPPARARLRASGTGSTAPRTTCTTCPACG